GLVTADETMWTREGVGRLAALARDHLDLARLLAESEVREPARLPPEPPALPARVRVAIARDAAFSFYYRDNLDRLAAAGAELVGWSPLADAGLPAGTRLLYLGGGYPEVHAPRLAANAAARAAVREFAAAGGAIYAECGGLMYLAEMLRTLDGTSHPMCGVLPLAVRMEPRLAALGYVEVAIAGDDGPPVRRRASSRSRRPAPRSCTRSARASGWWACARSATTRRRWRASRAWAATSCRASR